MPYNQWDFSQSILANQSGANMAAGIQQAGNAFAQGIQRYYQKKEENQKQEQTIQWLEQSGGANALFPQLAQVKDPAERRKIITAGIKGAGLENLVQIQQFQANQQRQQMEAQALAELRKSQIAKTQADMESRAREDTARRAALAGVPESAAAYGARGGYLTRDPAAAQPRTVPGTPEEMLQAYGAAGGTDPRFIDAVGKLRSSPNMSGLDFIEDPVTGERFAVSKKGSFAKSGTNPGKTADDPRHGVQQVKIGDRNYYYHADSKRYFDASGAPVVFPTASSQATVDAINNLAGGGDAGAAPAAPAVSPQDNPVQPAPVTITTKEQFDALQPGQSFIFNGRIGVKK